MIAADFQDLLCLLKSGLATSRALLAAAAAVRSGVTPKEIDAIAEAVILSEGCIPAFKGYRGFPCSVCVSTNDSVIHGIPNIRLFEPGDMVSIDTGSVYGGLYSDAAVTVVLTDGSPADQRKLDLSWATREALAAGVRAAFPGRPVSDITRAIENVARRAGLSVVKYYGGHGVGRSLHEPPTIPNSGPGGDCVLQEGQVIAIEPMLTLGGGKTVVGPDGWTVRTADGSLAAHWEHTILVSARGNVILTKC